MAINSKPINKLPVEPKDREIFRFGAMSFDVSLANKLIEVGILKSPLDEIPIDDYLKAMHTKVDPSKPYEEQSLGFLMGIDWSHVKELTAEDVERPGVVAVTKFGGILIDGNHRLMRKAMNKEKSIPVYVISKADLPKITPGTKSYQAALKKLRELPGQNIRVKAAVQGNPEEVMHVGKLTFDQKDGIGQVPDNREIGYKGIAVLMTPDQFLKLAAKTDFAGKEESTAAIKKAMAPDGRGIGSPFLDVSADKKGNFHVTSHEGRTRVKAIADVYGQVPVLVHIFTGSIRAKNLKIGQIAAMQSAMFPQDQNKIAKGPWFGRRVWWKGEWTDVGAPSASEAAVHRLLVMAESTTDFINDKYKRDLLMRMRDAIADMDFFNTDLRYIDRFESLIRELNNRPKIEITLEGINPSNVIPINAPLTPGVSPPFSN